MSLQNENKTDSSQTTSSTVSGQRWLFGVNDNTRDIK